MDDKNFDCLMNVYHARPIKQVKNLQWILFSATYPPELDSKYELVQERVAQIVTKAQ